MGVTHVLGLTVLAACVGPVLLNPVQLPKGCEGTKGGGGGGGKGKNGGGDLLDVDLEVLLAIDLSGLGKLLNELLGLLVGLLSEKDNKCRYAYYAEEMEGLVVKLQLYVKLLDIDVQVNLLLLLGPLLEAVLKVVQGLLKGIVVDLSIVLNLVLGLLLKLNLEIDADLMVKLGNILNLDLGVILKLG